MTAVYVLRHPQTTWNLAQRYQGRLDAPLSPEGRRQAELVSACFELGSLQVVYSSPLSRARYLAGKLVEVTEAPLRVDHRLTEIGMGAWEGLYLQEICERHPDLYEQWYVRPDTVRFPGGETLAEVCSRAHSVLSDIFRRHPSDNVAMVTHSAVIQVLVAAALSLDPRHIHRIRVANAGITTLCGLEAPGSLLAVNVTDPLYDNPVASATAQDCASWRPKRIAS